MEEPFPAIIRAKALTYRRNSNGNLRLLALKALPSWWTIPMRSPISPTGWSTTFPPVIEACRKTHRLTPPRIREQPKARMTSAETDTKVLARLPGNRTIISFACMPSIDFLICIQE